MIDAYTEESEKEQRDDKLIRWNAYTYEGDAGQCDVEGSYTHGHFKIKDGI